MGDLNDEMNRRLDEWRKRNEASKSPEPLPKTQKQGVYVSRKDFGDQLDEEHNDNSAI